MENQTRFYVVMGVAGCGKSTIGANLAEALRLTYVDGDDLHPTANINKMSRGEPLTDDDRWPWLAAVGSKLGGMSDGGVIGCSALKRAYREKISAAAGVPVTFIFLDGRRELIAARMGAREGHFMPTALLDSQFDTLEPPAADEPAITVDIDQEPQALVTDILQQL